MRSAIVAATLVPVLLASPAPAASAAQVTPPARSEVDRKRDHLLEVVTELRTRSPGFEDEAFRQARAATLDRLERYARAERFTINDAFGFPMPFFVDSRGTRCALAHLVDQSGRSELVIDLWHTANNAHVAELQGHAELLAWAQHAGLTLQEIAYIQGPGLGGLPPPPPEPPEPQPRVGEVDLTTPTPPSITERSGPTLTTPPTRPGTGLPGIRRRGVTGATLSWSQWWELDRSRYARVRERYARLVPQTDPSPASADAADPRRASLHARVLPVLRELLQEDSAISTTAAIGLATAATPGTVSETLEDLLALTRRVQGPDQVFAVLSLGLLPGGRGVPALQEIVRDHAGARKILGRSGSVPLRTRSFAALALGFSGHAAATEVLRERVENDRDVEVQRSAVLGLGLLAGGDDQDRELSRFLLQALADEDHDARVRTTLPLALGATADPATLAPIAEVVQRFRGPDEMRMACAFALGRLGEPMEPESLQGLMDLVRRDTSASVRHTALLALAERARRAGERPDVGTPEEVAALVQFLVHGIQRDYRQAADVPWHALAAGMVAHAHPTAAEVLEPALRKLLREGTRDDRAAAVVGLSLCGGSGARRDLAECLGQADDLIAGLAAEGLGLLGVQTSRDALREMVRDSDVEFVAHHAARGLALMADPSALLELHEAADRTSSDAVRGALLRALGEIGDPRSAPLLLRAAQDARADTMSRARAVGALAHLVREDEESFVIPLHRTAHSLLVSDAARELLSIR